MCIDDELASIMVPCFLATEAAQTLSYSSSGIPPVLALPGALVESLVSYKPLRKANYSVLNVVYWVLCTTNGPVSAHVFPHIVMCLRTLN